MDRFVLPHTCKPSRGVAGEAQSVREARDRSATQRAMQKLKYDAMFPAARSKLVSTVPFANTYGPFMERDSGPTWYGSPLYRELRMRNKRKAVRPKKECKRMPCLPAIRRLKVEDRAASHEHISARPAFSCTCDLYLVADEDDDRSTEPREASSEWRVEAARVSGDRATSPHGAIATDVLVEPAPAAADDTTAKPEVATWEARGGDVQNQQTARSARKQR